jgi:hypothetical protein
MIFDVREESWRTTTTTSLVPAERCTVLTRTMVGVAGTPALATADSGSTNAMTHDEKTADTKTNFKVERITAMP